jgi:hypothetical protein
VWRVRSGTTSRPRWRTEMVPDVSPGPPGQPGGGPDAVRTTRCCAVTEATRSNRMAGHEGGGRGTARGTTCRIARADLRTSPSHPDPDRAHPRPPRPVRPGRGRDAHAGSRRADRAQAGQTVGAVDRDRSGGAGSGAVFSMETRCDLAKSVPNPSRAGGCAPGGCQDSGVVHCSPRW